ncbi:methyltransferase [Alterisphingorhabdus coralli]|uniref:Methyltransferase n=1 Tax=Alterisphingorhabdus coralli TaxID=3071408 RepID=A0AA97F8N5_9SPHN|nr:methyltransferase [Parasphingorhabdus sp. SCSIO 66989]WOE74515.1 methyltransferase [Parasphingorhabdus sp. SCSIO 66989]
MSWASNTPLVRGFARRKAAAQFNLINGFIYSQIIGVVVETGLLEFLSDGIHSLEEVAGHCGLSHHAADRLLRAARSLELVESPVAGGWSLGVAGAPLSSNEGAKAMARHRDMIYRDITDLLDLLRDDRRSPTRLSNFWSYAAQDEAEPNSASDYSALMAATQPMVAEQIVHRYGFGRHSKMLDIGGGSGAFAAAVAEVAPQLDIGIFDLPEVMPSTAERLAALGLEERITAHPGSFITDALPSGYDLITLNRILHDHDDPIVTALLAKIQASLPANGRLLIIEPMAETRGAEPMGDGYFGLYLWAMRSGRPRSLKEYRQMLKNAGFSRSKEIKTSQPLITKAIVADK